MDTAVAVATVAPIAAGYVFALCYAVVTVTRTAGLSDTEKLIWAAAIIVVPVFAAVAWCFAAPRLSVLPLR
jgi:Phospholipase_D-nuclease N-terminal